MSFKSFVKKWKLVLLILLVIDFFIPDPIPLVDELVLGILTLYGWV